MNAAQSEFYRPGSRVYLGYAIRRSAPRCIDFAHALAQITVLNTLNPLFASPPCSGEKLSEIKCTWRKKEGYKRLAGFESTLPDKTFPPEKIPKFFLPDRSQVRKLENSLLTSDVLFFSSVSRCWPYCSVIIPLSRLCAAIRREEGKKRIKNKGTGRAAKSSIELCC